MRPLERWWLAVLVHAEDGATLAETNRIFTSASANVFHLKFMLMPEELHREPPGRRDLGLAMLPRLGRQPVRSLMCEQQTHIVLLRPDIDAAFAHGVKLTRVPNQSFLVVAARELQKRRVTPRSRSAASRNSAWSRNHRAGSRRGSSMPGADRPSTTRCTQRKRCG